MSILELPEILNIPSKLLPLIENINNYRYFLLDGGRGSAKTNTIARLILYLAEQYKIRIVCGRETQTSIDESVYTVLRDLVNNHNLYFDVLATKINHKSSGSEIRFRGFREQGAVGIKGLEGIDVLWIDEAQSITKETLDIIIPTIRKDTARIFFTMNRFLRNDPVYERFAGRRDCLHIKINFDENEFCPDALKAEAEECLRRSEKDYRHIWLGEPLDQTEDYLFNFAKLEKMAELEPFGDLLYKQSCMSVDLAGAGGDLCVASLLERKSNVHWELTDQRAWSDADTDLSIGKVIALKSLWKPSISIVDKGGLGYPMFVTMQKSIPELIGFDGANASKQHNTGNARADGYATLKDWIDQEWLICKSDITKKQLETIKKRYLRNGKIYIMSKKEMKDKDHVDSPDYADSLMMAVYGVRYFMNRKNMSEDSRITRVNYRVQPMNNIKRIDRRQLVNAS